MQMHTATGAAGVDGDGGGATVVVLMVVHSYLCQGRTEATKTDRAPSVAYFSKWTTVMKLRLLGVASELEANPAAFRPNNVREIINNPPCRAMIDTLLICDCPVGAQAAADPKKVLQLMHRLNRLLTHKNYEACRPSQCCPMPNPYDRPMHMKHHFSLLLCSFAPLLLYSFAPL
eukprot:scaffold84451_cov34-Prasinocladus_malaysianus.AAC.1